jgi:hypothetical protein
MDLRDVFVSNNKDKKVVLYAREPKATALLFRKYGDIIIKKYLKVENYSILSDYPQETDDYIDLKKFSIEDLSTDDFDIILTALDIESIIKNDRTFRIALPYYDALQLIYSTAKYIIEYFKNNKVDILVTHMVDCYTVDILTRIARHFGVIIIPYCTSSFGGDYIMITERGESHFVREPSEDEIVKLKGALENKFSNPYVKSRLDVNIYVAKYYFLYKIKYVWHYLILHKLFGRMEYRYLMTKSETYPRSIKNIFNIKKYFIQDIKEISLLNKRKLVYIPLHYYPEATTEYWIQNEKFITYYPSLFKIIKNYTERGFTVLIKEHTAMYKMRDKALYEKIIKIPNTYLVSPYVSTYEMLENVEYTVLWTGTTGIEAILADKKVVLTETETYYSFGQLKYIGDEENVTLFSDNQKKEMIRKILATHLPLN